jgi:hypothetical protein
MNFLATTAVLMMLFLAGCTASKFRTTAAPKAHDIETLQSSVSLALNSKAGKMAGQGVLFYRKPDSFRLSILSPLGQVIMDIVVNGEEVTCLIPPRKEAWQGTMRSLPERLGMHIWPLMQWAVESSDAPGPSLEREFMRPDGTTEKVYFNAVGLVVRKVNSHGDMVSYDSYNSFDGAAFPTVVEIVTREESRLKIVFDDPEVNRPIEKGIMRPQLDGVQMHPLSEFRNF